MDWTDRSLPQPDMVTLTRTVAPLSDPVTLAETKLRLRLIDTYEDSTVLACISEATLECEHLLGRALMPQTWLLTRDRFAYSMPLQRPTVTAVTTVKYVDDTGVLQTLSATVYQAALASDYTARVLLAYGQIWPSVRRQAEAVQITFTCGYADAASVPAPIKAWIIMRVGAKLENREETAVLGRGETMAEMPFMDSQLDRYRTWLT